MFVACGIWCLADVSSVSPSSEQNKTVFQKTLTRFWTVNSVKYENVIIGAIKRNTSDLELRKGKTKVGKQGFRSLYLFEITK